MRYLLLLLVPLVSYSQPDCKILKTERENLKENFNKAYADFMKDQDSREKVLKIYIESPTKKNREDYLKANVDELKRHADYLRTEAAYLKAVVAYKAHCG